jgi:competence protein ComEA
MDLSKRELLLIGLVVVLLAINIGLILKIEDRSEGSVAGENLDSFFAEAEEYMEAEIVIHVTGEVKESGVVYMPEGARVVDAVNAAGGALETGDLDRINLAKVLQDGEKVHIPAMGEVVDNYAYSDYNGQADGVININTAGAYELESLQGIGPVLAARIVDFREKEGRFEKPEDIMKVSGIGTKIYESLKDSIRVR